MSPPPIRHARPQVYEPVLILGKDKFEMVDIRIRCKGGGYVSQIYAIRQAIAKALVAYYQKCAPATEAARGPLTSPRRCAR